MKDIQRALRSGNRAHYMDRYVFGAHLPRIISALLVLLSGDVIASGALRLSQRVGAIIW
jgi:hypothetical protein